MTVSAEMQKYPGSFQRIAGAELESIQTCFPSLKWPFALRLREYHQQALELSISNDLGKLYQFMSITGTTMNAPEDVRYSVNTNFIERRLGHMATEMKALGPQDFQKACKISEFSLSVASTDIVPAEVCPDIITLGNSLSDKKEVIIKVQVDAFLAG